MMPLAQTWETARTVALLALNSAMNGTDSETTTVRITTAASNRIDLRYCKRPSLGPRCGFQYSTFPGLHNSAHPAEICPTMDRPDCPSRIAPCRLQNKSPSH